jgi:peptide/nickel transport system permease protein
VAAGRDGSGRTAGAGARSALAGPSASIGNRLATAIPVLWGVTFLTFAVIQLLPGDAAQQLLGINATPEQLQEFRDKLNLDDSFLVRYFHWLGDVLTGDLGHSLASDQPVTSIISEGLPTTFELLLYALVISLALTVPLALLAARNPGGFVDRVGMVTSMAGLSVANYVLALVLVYVFAVKLGWLPAIYTNDTGSPGELIKSLTLPGALDRLPALLLLHPTAARGHPRADAGRGLRRHRRRRRASGPWRVLTRHALPNSLFGLLTIVALNLGTLIGATVIIEQIFAVPGNRPLAAGGDQQPRRAGGGGDRARPRRGGRRSPTCWPTCSTQCLDPRIRYGRSAP